MLFKSRAEIIGHNLFYGTDDYHFVKDGCGISAYCLDPGGGSSEWRSSILIPNGGIRSAEHRDELDHMIVEVLNDIDKSFGSISFYLLSHNASPVELIIDLAFNNVKAHESDGSIYHAIREEAIHATELVAKRLGFPFDVELSDEVLSFLND